MEFKFCQNGSRNYTEGILIGITGMESSSFTTVPSNAQIYRRRLPTIDLGVINNAKPYLLNHHPSTMPTTFHNAHHRTPRPPSVTVTNGHHHPQSSHIAPNDHNAHQHRVNERQPGATSFDVATRRRTTTFVVVRHRSYSYVSIRAPLSFLIATNSHHHPQPSPTAPNDHDIPQYRRNDTPTPRDGLNNPATSPTQ